MLGEQDYHLVDKSWGFEHWIVNNDLYCGKELVCLYNRWSSKGKFHYHREKSETFYITTGELEIELQQIEEKYGKVANVGRLSRFVMREGDSLSLEPFIAHRFRARTAPIAKFFEFSTHHEDGDSYYLEQEN